MSNARALNGRAATQADVNAGTVVFYIPDGRSTPYQFGRDLPLRARLLGPEEQSGFPDGTVVTCALTSSPTGAQSLPTCSLNPASITFTAGGTGTTTLSVKTTAASNSALARLRHTGWGFGGGAVIAAVLFFGVPSRRRRWLQAALLLNDPFPTRFAL